LPPSIAAICRGIPEPEIPWEIDMKISHGKPSKLEHQNLMEKINAWKIKPGVPFLLGNCGWFWGGKVDGN